MKEEGNRDRHSTLHSPQISPNCEDERIHEGGETVEGISELLAEARAGDGLSLAKLSTARLVRVAARSPPNFRRSLR